MAMSSSTGPAVVSVRLMHIDRPTGDAAGKWSDAWSAKVDAPIVTDPATLALGAMKTRTVPHVAR